LTNLLGNKGEGIPLNEKETKEDPRIKKEGFLSPLFEENFYESIL